MPVAGPTPPDSGMSAEAVSLERQADRVSSRSAVFRNGVHVGDLAWTLTDDKVLEIFWRGEPLTGFSAWSGAPEADG